MENPAATTALSGFQESEAAAQQLRRFKGRFNLFLYSFLGQFLLGILTFVVIFALGLSLRGNNFNDSLGLAAGLIFSIGSLAQFILFVLAIVGFFLFHYHAWQAISGSDFQPRTTPDKAIGYLFIPFFNLYWLFVSFHGLTQDYNRYLRHHGLELKPAQPLYALLPPLIALINFLGFVFLWVLLVQAAGGPVEFIGLYVALFSILNVVYLVTLVMMIRQEYSMIKRLLEFRANLF